MIRQKYRPNILLAKNFKIRMLCCQSYNIIRFFFQCVEEILNEFKQYRVSTMKCIDFIVQSVQ
jgi:hypothetical protein